MADNYSKFDPEGITSAIRNISFEIKDMQHNYDLQFKTQDYIASVFDNIKKINERFEAIKTSIGIFILQHDNTEGIQYPDLSILSKMSFDGLMGLYVGGRIKKTVDSVSSTGQEIAEKVNVGGKNVIDTITDSKIKKAIHEVSSTGQEIAEKVNVGGKNVIDTITDSKIKKAIHEVSSTGQEIAEKVNDGGKNVIDTITDSKIKKAIHKVSSTGQEIAEKVNNAGFSSGGSGSGTGGSSTAETNTKPARETTNNGSSTGGSGSETENSSATATNASPTGETTNNGTSSGGSGSGTGGSSTVETNTGTINTTAVNVRSGPGMSNEVKNWVAQGDEVEILETDGIWTKIKSNGNEGWIATKYITQGDGNGFQVKPPQSSSASDTSSVPSSTPNTQGNQSYSNLSGIRSDYEGLAYVNTKSGNLNFRASPMGDVIDGIPSGSEVTVLSDSNEDYPGWVHIQYGGKEGWVYRDYLGIR